MREAYRRSGAAALCAAALVFAASCRHAPAVVSVVTRPAAETETGEAVSQSLPPAPPGDPGTTAPAAGTTTALPPETAAPTAAPTAPPQETTAPPEAAEQPADTVTLPIALPAANGEMQVSTSPDNPFIRAVSESRGRDVSLLAAVYSVPASGQNYVFEFTGADARTADDLRRVYLLSDDAEIRSVAASSAAERERISLTENWFCMNVLIKGVIFPSVQEKMQDPAG